MLEHLVSFIVYYIPNALHVCLFHWEFDQHIYIATNVYYVSVLDNLRKSCARTPCVFHYMLYYIYMYCILPIICIIFVFVAISCGDIPLDSFVRVEKNHTRAITQMHCDKPETYSSVYMYRNMLHQAVWNRGQNVKVFMAACPRQY